MENKRCPIQVIYNAENPLLRWVTKLSDIDLKRNVIETCVLLSLYDGSVSPLLSSNSQAPKRDWVRNLFLGDDMSPIQKADRFRNPTIEELNTIKDVLKASSYVYNRKKNQLIDLRKVNIHNGGVNKN